MNPLDATSRWKMGSSGLEVSCDLPSVIDGFFHCPQFPFSSPRSSETIIQILSLCVRQLMSKLVNGFTKYWPLQMALCKLDGPPKDVISLQRTVLESVTIM